MKKRLNIYTRADFMAMPKEEIMVWWIWMTIQADPGEVTIEVLLDGVKQYRRLGLSTVVMMLAAKGYTK